MREGAAHCGPSAPCSLGCDERYSTTDRPPQARGQCRRRLIAGDAGPAVALYLAVRPARSEAPRRVRDRAPVRRQVRHHRGAVHLQMGDRRARRAWHRAGRAGQLARLGFRRPGGDDARLWRHAHRDGTADAMARRHFRQGGDERGAPAGDAHLRAYAPALAALSSRAQDRRTDARAGARPQRHRDHRAHGAVAARPDRRRARPGRRRAARTFRLALRRRRRHHGGVLYVVHLCRDRVAHRHPPQDERERQRRQRQGDRFAA